MGDQPTTGTYATPAEAADRFGISRVTVYRMCQRGELDAVRVGGQWRIPREALDRLAAGGAVDEQPDSADQLPDSA